MSFVTGFSDQVYSIDYLQENGLCQPIADVRHYPPTQPLIYMLPNNL